MKPIQAHDSMPRPESHPAEDFRGLRRILAMFIAGIAICAGICAAAIIRGARRQRAVPLHARACTCMGRCMRFP